MTTAYAHVVTDPDGVVALAATPATLRSGDWGARTDRADVGDARMLRVTTRSGKEWTKKHRCIATGADWALWAVDTGRRRTARSRGCCPQNGDTCQRCGGSIA